MIFQKLKVYLQPIFEILRWNKPTGRIILLIPACWSLWLTPNDQPDYQTVFKIIIGGIFVSGLGCIANDIWDKDIDKKVLRTRNRPLASDKIDIKFAFILLFLLLFLSFLITLSLPEEGRYLSLFLAFLALPLILIYPSSKRWFKFPQLILSICWGFAVLIPWAAHEGNIFNPVLLCCWLATVLWTFGFDTIYALADKDYDLKIGVNSSAITLGALTKNSVHFCYFGTCLFIGICGIINQLNIVFWIILLIVALLMQKDINKVFKSKEINLKKISNHFKNQAIYGGLILGALIIA